MLQKISNKLRSHTVPIYKGLGNDLKPHGSGVLINSGSQYFIVTAAHVIEEEYRDEILIYTGEDNFRRLGKRGIAITALRNIQDGEKNRKNDKFDVGIIKLQNAEMINELEKNYEFLSFRGLNNNHSFEKDNKYFVLGYPAYKVKINPFNKTISVPIFVLPSKLSEFTLFDKYKCEEKNNFFIDYPKKWQNNEKIVKAIDPRGISGCGVWHIDDSDSKENRPIIKYSLVGIMIEYQTKYARVLIGTKIKFVSDIMNTVFNTDVKM